MTAYGLAEIEVSERDVLARRRVRSRRAAGARGGRGTSRAPTPAADAPARPAAAIGVAPSRAKIAWPSARAAASPAQLPRPSERIRPQRNRAPLLPAVGGLGEELPRPRRCARQPRRRARARARACSSPARRPWLVPAQERLGADERRRDREPRSSARPEARRRVPGLPAALASYSASRASAVSQVASRIGDKRRDRSEREDRLRVGDLVALEATRREIRRSPRDACPRCTSTCAASPSTHVSICVPPRSRSHSISFVGLAEKLVPAALVEEVREQDTRASTSRGARGRGCARTRDPASTSSRPRARFSSASSHPSCRTRWRCPRPEGRARARARAPSAGRRALLDRRGRSVRSPASRGAREMFSNPISRRKLDALVRPLDRLLRPAAQGVERGHAAVGEHQRRVSAVLEKRDGLGTHLACAHGVSMTPQGAAEVRHREPGRAVLACGEELRNRLVVRRLALHESSLEAAARRRA